MTINDELTRRNAHVYAPTHDGYAVHAYTWPTVLARRSARVTSFQIQTDVRLDSLLARYHDRGVMVFPVFRYEEYPHVEDMRDRNPFEHNDDEEEVDPTTPAVTLVYDLPGNIRVWAQQGGAKSALYFHLSGDYDADLETPRRELEKMLPPRAVAAGKIAISFTYAGEYGATSIDRDILAEDWGKIRANYSMAALPQLDALVGLKPDMMTAGKIGILHGPPGTGKTHLIRALAQSWKSWASIKYILDVEKFFGDAGYMMDVVLRNPAKHKWNVILCEDAEEYIAPGAKQKVGQALSRLLNMGDGLVGQGLQLLMLFTTNAPEMQLHPAITRAGRCFVKAHLPLLSAAEASHWLGERVTEPTALGELYERRARSQIVIEESSKPVGAFL